jgi:DNA-binding transcriptional LysR family regulator
LVIVIEKTGQSRDHRLRLSLRQLEVFVATARAGTTRGAGERVARSQSAASAALAELETTIGAPLFDRVGRRLVLNENGRTLLPATIALLDQAAELQGLFASEYRAPLRVAASFTIGEYLLPERIARWKAEQPGSFVQLRIGNTSEVIRAVIDMEVDIGFIEGPQTHPDLTMRRWLEDEMVIIGAPAHPLVSFTVPRKAGARSGATLTPKMVSHRQLAASSWIMREPGSGTRQAADAWLLEHLGPLEVEYELGSTEAIKRLAAAGAGLACLSRHAVASELDQGRLVELRTRLPRASRRLAIAVRRNRRLGRAAQEFMRHCSD